MSQLTNQQLSFIIKTLKSQKSDDITEAFDLISTVSDFEFNTEACVEISQLFHSVLSNDQARISDIVGCINVWDRLPNTEDFRVYVERFSSSKSMFIRKAIAQSLGDFVTYDETTNRTYGDPLLIQTCIKLCKDPSARVRDWAAHQFSNAIENDTPEVRSILKKLLTDNDFDVRTEAISGLVMRRDKTLYPQLLKKLNRLDVAPIWLRAVVGSRDKYFLEQLHSLECKCKESKKYQYRSAEVQDAIDELLA